MLALNVGAPLGGGHLLQDVEAAHNSAALLDVHKKYHMAASSHSSNCTYCRKPAGFVTRGVTAPKIEVHEAYQLLNHGWRRFGSYLWCQAEDICCKQTPIRVDVYDHPKHVTKDNKKVWRRLEKYLRKLSAPAPSESLKAPSDRKCFSCGYAMVHLTHEDDLPKGYRRPICDVCHMESINLTEGGYYHCDRCQIDVHKGCQFQGFAEHIQNSIPEGLVWEYTGRQVLQVKLSAPSFSEEKYRLFLKYQQTVHGEGEGSGLSVLRIGEDGDDPNMTDRDRFIKYLVDSPLYQDREAYPTTDLYGTFHIEYRLDGELFMTTVTDVLPNCLNSVYCFYDPDMRCISPGKFSILFEMAWMRKQAKYQHFAHYYLGMYFPHPKMLYKADFKPAELLNGCEWRPFAEYVHEIGEATKPSKSHDSAPSSSSAIPCR
eukprot:TRINITY_DN22637_c0_g1_i1.p1 TRINITY_DN22637_c0_g1~~TRINITY_DN22637_c0_g1_i1.p1  ORF type:complete len:429 (+),score=142.87 TRINITY_DN22637_c0_g1_i1:49-1335(+)